VINPPKANIGTRHACPICNRTFGRSGDYRRHMKKHGPPSLRCNVINCDKTFYRVDKVRDHMKQGHKWNW
ncbi:MAG: C2H2-type zinc finger protein, partial [Cytophagaceae bacterium]